MSEPPPPTTPDGAVRVFIGLFILGFVLHGVDTMHEPGFYWNWVVAGVLAVVDYYWVSIRKSLGPRFSLRATAVVTDFRWWVGAIVACMIFIAAPPILEHGRLPMGLDLGLRAQPPSTAPTVIHDPPTAEDIARATAPIRLERDRALSDLAISKSRIEDLTGTANSKDQEIRTLQQRLAVLEKQPPQAPPPKPSHQSLGPMSTMAVLEALKYNAPHYVVRLPAGMPTPPSPNPAEHRWAVLVTGDTATTDLIYQLLHLSLDAVRLDVPDHSANLDAPVVPESTISGITLHGDSVLNERLFQVLQSCFNIHRTSRTIDGLREWYRNRIAEAQEVVWIEIGPGSIWKDRAQCAN